MTTTQTTLEEYKKAVREKYEEEKSGEYSSFLLSPSRAKLRQLCLERMKDNLNQDDLRSFSLFLGFEFNLSNLNKLKSQNDKFRPIETFLKGETDLTDIEGVNIAALLVGFHPRPFKKFSKKAAGTEFETELKPQDNFVKDINGLKGFVNPVVGSPLIVPITKNKRTLQRKIGIGVIIVVTIFSVGYTTKQFILPGKTNMQWQSDHYEMFNSGDTIMAGDCLPRPFDPVEFNRRKLKVCDTCTFFKNSKPIVWYSKHNNVVEFFNMDGVHPENGAELKRITRHMIDTHVKPCE